MTAPQPLIAGNWKMNGLSASLAEARAVAAGLGDTPARVAICPPSILIHRLAEALKGTTVLVGGQDHHWDDAGAFTGDISAEMLADAGAKLAILGHSERRAGYRETDAVVAQKVSAALRAGLEPIVCVGETLEQRQAGETLALVTGQFGEEGRKVPILYGGSVKPGNASEILHAAEVGGALVGGASLKAEDFLGIIRAL